MFKKKALVVGGTSGLGLELAKLLRPRYDIVVTGRSASKCPLYFDFLKLNLDIEVNFTEKLRSYPKFDLVVIAAGFFQKGKLLDLSTNEIINMSMVGFISPTLLIHSILRRQSQISDLIVITSTSQWTPRPEEPVYTGVKAGIAMVAKSLSLDPAFGKVIVAAPAGMKK